MPILKNKKQKTENRKQINLFRTNLSKIENINKIQL